MSIQYQDLLKQGMAIGQTLFTETAEEKQAYNSAYKTEANKMALQNQLGISTLNIAKAKSDRILSDSNIQAQRDAVEAQIRLNAAVAGNAGSSVKALINDANYNEAEAMARTREAEKQVVEQQLGQINATTLKLQGEKHESYSFTAAAISNIAAQNIFDKGENHDKESKWEAFSSSASEVASSVSKNWFGK